MWQADQFHSIRAQKAINSNGPNYQPSPPPLPIIEKNAIGTEEKSKGHMNFYSTAQFTDGEHRFEIKIVSGKTFFIGIASGIEDKLKQVDGWSNQDNAYCYCNGDGGSIGKEKWWQTKVGDFKAGDSITIHLDLDQQKLKFSKNGQFVGKQIKIKKLSYRLAVGLSDGGSKVILSDGTTAEKLIHNLKNDKTNLQQQNDELKQQRDDYKRELNELREKMKRIQNDQNQKEQKEAEFDVNTWLSDAVALGQYGDTFIEAGFEDRESVLELTMDDLKEIGIVKLGHRKKILKGIAALKQN